MRDRSDIDWKEVDLNKIALKDFAERSDNPLKDAVYQEEWLCRVQRNVCGGSPTYGGFLEDRSFLWRGFEDSKHMLHLGIDINNLECDIDICAPADLTIHHVFKHDATFNGWGGRIIAELDTEYKGAKYLLLGHLNPQTLPSVGQRFCRYQVLARLGSPSNNGNWFCHLHVQLNKQKFMDRYKDNLDLLDGYALTDSEVKEVDDLVTDPTELILAKSDFT